MTSNPMKAASMKTKSASIRLLFMCNPSSSCHPERNECFAKRSTHGVEGSLPIQQNSTVKRRSHFVYAVQRENSPQPREYTKDCRDPSTAREFALRTLAALRMTIHH